MASLARLCQLALLAALLPRGVVGHRPEGGFMGSKLHLSHHLQQEGPEDAGSLPQAPPDPDGDQWLPPGIGILAHALAKSGNPGAAEAVRQNPMPVAAAFLFLACSGVLAALAICCCCRRQPTEAAAAAGQAGEGGGGQPQTQAEGGSAQDPEEVPLPQKLAKLKKEKARMLFEQAMQRNKLEKLIEGILKLEAELRHQDQPFSAEEVQKRADNALRSAEMLTEKSLLSALAYVAPLAMQGNRVYEVFEHRKNAVQGRVAKLAWDEAQSLCRDMQDVFGIDEEVRSSMFGTLRGVEVPSIATVLSNVLAPLRLRLLLITLQLCVAVDTLYALVSIIVIVTDRRLFCGRETGISSWLIYWWFSVDLAVTVACMHIRIWGLMRVSRSVQNIDTPPEPPDDPVKAFRMLLDYYMTAGSEALERYDEHMSSYLYYFANVSVFFYFCWMVYATHLVFNTPWAHCITAGLIILRIRVCLFLIFLLPLVVALVSFVVSSYLNSESFRVGLLSAADSADKLLQTGIPVVSIIVQGFLVRSSHDFTYMNLRRCELKHHDLTRQEQEAKAKLSKVESERVELSQELDRLHKKREEEAAMSECELKAKHLAERDAILQDAEKLFEKLSGKAESLSREAEMQVKKWEEAGSIGITDLVDSGMSMAQAQEYMMQAAQEAQSKVQLLAQDEGVRQALGQLQESARTGVQAVQERAKDLPSIDAAMEQSQAALNVAVEQSQVALNVAAEQSQGALGGMSPAAAQAGAPGQAALPLAPQVPGLSGPGGPPAPPGPSSTGDAPAAG